jgi:hypothetical protein
MGKDIVLAGSSDSEEEFEGDAFYSTLSPSEIDEKLGSSPMKPSTALTDVDVENFTFATQASLEDELQPPPWPLGNRSSHPQGSRRVTTSTAQISYPQKNRQTPSARQKGAEQRAQYFLTARSTEAKTPPDSSKSPQTLTPPSPTRRQHRRTELQSTPSRKKDPPPRLELSIPKPLASKSSDGFRSKNVRPEPQFDEQLPGGLFIDTTGDEVLRSLLINDEPPLPTGLFIDLTKEEDVDAEPALRLSEEQKKVLKIVLDG